MYDLIYFMITLIFRQSLSPYYFLKFPLKILNTIPDQGPADETPPILARGTAANAPAFNPQRTAVIVAQPDGGQEFRRVTDKPGIGVFVTRSGFTGSRPPRIGALPRPVGDHPLHHLRHCLRRF